MESLRWRMSRFAWYAWVLLAYNMGVILWGAYVRATGSGAGCGNHWPLCNGQVVPRAPQLATLIEFTHRASSGLALVLVACLVVWAQRAFERGDRVRLGAVLSLFFVLTEAGVGAGLVLFQLVARNESIARAASVAVHLANTFMLLASLALTAWWASGAPAPRLRGQGARAWPLMLALAGVLALGASGAITALGDTLFPAPSLAQGFSQDWLPTSSLLLRMRLVHPALAILVSGWTLAASAWVVARAAGPAIGKLGRAVWALVLLQLTAGILDVTLLAPVWLQQVHLVLADLVWVALVLLAAAALSEPRRAARQEVPSTAGGA